MSLLHRHPKLNKHSNIIKKFDDNVSPIEDNTRYHAKIRARNIAWGGTTAKEDVLLAAAFAGVDTALSSDSPAEAAYNFTVNFVPRVANTALLFWVPDTLKKGKINKILDNKIDSQCISKLKAENPNNQELTQDLDKIDAELKKENEKLSNSLTKINFIQNIFVFAVIGVGAAFILSALTTVSLAASLAIFSVPSLGMGAFMGKEMNEAHQDLTDHAASLQSERLSTRMDRALEGIDDKQTVQTQSNDIKNIIDKSESFKNDKSFLQLLGACAAGITAVLLLDAFAFSLTPLTGSLLFLGFILPPVIAIGVSKAKEEITLEEKIDNYLVKNHNSLMKSNEVEKEKSKDLDQSLDHNQSRPPYLEDILNGQHKVKENGHGRG